MIWPKSIYLSILYDPSVFYIYRATELTEFHKIKENPLVIELQFQVQNSELHITYWTNKASMFLEIVCSTILIGQWTLFAC